MEHLPDFLKSTLPDSKIAKNIKYSRTKATATVKSMGKEYHIVVWTTGNISVKAIRPCILYDGIMYGDVAVASCYHPSGTTILEQDIKALLTVGPSVITIGEFNAKVQDWNSQQLNPSGAALRRFLENTVDVVALGPVESTFDEQGRFAPDVLDIAYSRRYLPKPTSPLTTRAAPTTTRCC
ncbi:hypothetical protein NQ315_013247 [Exocentrus adspersus]|uniref:Endonuclease/exonuclease/phosphatase domain-containing protein n=1 Tax=Exocentrus adspersus TaxID=1586481 RepID=A0AAV8V7D2_9CUCU|nr:hypothetical protein NQ315_013247 [Exocentrus adspersus]